MKKIIIAILVLLLAGCTTQVSDESVDETPTVEDFGQIDSDVAKLFDKFHSLKDIGYEDKSGDTTIVQDNIVRVNYIKSQKLNEFFYNALELDRELKTAKISCNNICNKYDQDKVVLIVDYDDYNFETIHDMVHSISSAQRSELAGGNILSRKTILIDTNIGKVWIDDTHGIPLKIENKIELKNIDLNKNVKLGFAGFTEMTAEEYFETE